MKSSSYFHLILPSIVCLFAPAAALAQEGEAVSLKVDLVAWGHDIPGLSVTAANKKEGVTAKAFQYSKAVSYAGSNVMEIYQSASAGSEKNDPGAPVPPQPAQAGKPPASTPASTEPVSPELLKRRKEKPDLVALAAIPANSKRVTVLLAPGPDHTYKTVVIDDDPSKLPLGNLRIHNYSAFVIAMRCNGTTAKELKTRDAFVVKPKNHQVIYELAYQDGEEWKMLENNIVRVGDEEQAQMIVLKSDAEYFQATNGTRSGFLQAVILRRQKEAPEP
ncbi:hypothetical protein KBB96_13105 [Luteolibacter ambystomatis]|uniref:Uncharacterized protein n=1 Tax=Luteolibacter ambystomatis TaxID=2824561 RepID=A0A975G6Q3_9BACT|nr:hypothetical protein [Luteolibacter ambystomatis]QUE49808.1 hypothetical protein KBB96_13105 [Luteolibacter ambystomatis]